MTPDVLVVGAGPVGLTAALELARRGVAVRIVDAGDGPTPLQQSRALAVQPRTLRFLQPSGVTDELLRQGSAIRRFTAIEDGRPRVTLDLDVLSGDFPFLLSIPQGATERILIAALAKRGVKVERGVSFASLADPDRPRVRLAGADGAEEEVTPRIVIGADGARSEVREAIGVAFEGERSDIAFGLADVQFDRWIDRHEAVAIVTPTATVGMIPMSHDTARYVGTAPDILSVVPVEPAIVLTTWATTFRVAFRAVDHMQKGAVFLAGDAAHVHSPVGGRGMNLGMEDAATLAWMIWRGGQRHYERERLPVAHRVVADTKALTAAIGKRDGSARLRRHLLFAALNLPGLRAVAARRLTGDDLPPSPWLAEEGGA